MIAYSYSYGMNSTLTYFVVLIMLVLVCFISIFIFVFCIIVGIGHLINGIRNRLFLGVLRLRGGPIGVCLAALVGSSVTGSFGLITFRLLMSSSGRSSIRYGFGGASFVFLSIAVFCMLINFLELSAFLQFV